LVSGQIRAGFVAGSQFCRRAAPAGARREVRVRLRMIVVDKDYVFTVCSKR
jgi:hypothetical protein